MTTTSTLAPSGSEAIPTAARACLPRSPIADTSSSLTKRDLVDDETLALATEEIEERLAGTVLADAAVVAVSSVTGEGIGELTIELDAMLDDAGAPETARARLFVDRVFTIKGAGTVVTGTLAGDCLAVGDGVEVYPTGTRARIRSLQTHRRDEVRACPVARVAANLAGAERGSTLRGHVLARPDAWRPTRIFEAWLRPVRGLTHELTARGAFKLHVGAADADVRVRLYGTTRLRPGETTFVRITASRPLVLDVGDRYVLREAGRRETVGGGAVLDVAPPPRPGTDPAMRLGARLAAARDELPGLLVHERGAVSKAEAELTTGSHAAGGPLVGSWFVDERVRASVRDAFVASLETYHRAHPLDEGADVGAARREIRGALRMARAPVDASLADALLDDLAAEGAVVRDAATVRLATHRVTLDARAPDLERLLDAIGGDREATPPGVKELVAAGVGRDVIDAAARSGAVVKIALDIVVTPGLIARAETVIGSATGGITVGAFREALGTSRKYAVPLLEWFDQRGTTRREGDLRFLRRRD